MPNGASLPKSTRMLLYAPRALTSSGICTLPGDTTSASSSGDPEHRSVSPEARPVSSTCSMPTCPTTKSVGALRISIPTDRTVMSGQRDPNAATAARPAHTSAAAVGSATANPIKNVVVRTASNNRPKMVGRKTDFPAVENPALAIRAPGQTRGTRAWVSIQAST